jgi:hypothetical protein
MERIRCLPTVYIAQFEFQRNREALLVQRSCHNNYELINLNDLKVGQYCIENLLTLSARARAQFYVCHIANGQLVLMRLLIDMLNVVEHVDARYSCQTASAPFSLQLLLMIDADPQRISTVFRGLCHGQAALVR